MIRLSRLSKRLTQKFYDFECKGEVILHIACENGLPKDILNVLLFLN